MKISCFVAFFCKLQFNPPDYIFYKSGNMKNTIVAKKHWVSYVIPALVVLVGLSFTNGGASSLFFAFLLMLGGVIRIMQVNSVKWTFTGELLIVQKGILPWTRTYLEIPVFDIYESLMNFGMLGHFLKYGNITIRRTEGITSKISEAALVNANELSMKINTAVRQFKMGKNGIVTPSPVPAGKSVAEELKHLAELKASGNLTQEEYDVLKKRAIDE